MIYIRVNGDDVCREGLTHYFHELLKWEGPVRCHGVVVEVECSILQPLESYIGQIDSNHCKGVTDTGKEGKIIT